MSRPASIFGEEHLPLSSRVSNSPFVVVIWAYRFTLSPVIGRQCRFDPTCSRYALDAFRRYGTARGVWMTIARIGRCHPFNKGGYDPVPALAARRDINSEHSLDCDPNEEGKRGHA